MRGSVKSSNFSGVAGAAAALWLLLAGPAWAGGGMDAGTLLAALCQDASNLSGFVGKTIPCPQYPTYFQINTDTTKTTISAGSPIALELAAWQGITPNVLSPDSVLQADSDCGLGTPGPQYCPLLAVNASNRPAKSPFADPSTAISYLNPLAFVSPTSTTPFTVTQSSDPTATSYVYAVALDDQNGQPQALDLIFDFVTGTKKPGPKGQGPIVISLPLATLGGGAATENSIVATLTANCSGPGACNNVSVSTNPPLSGKKPPYSPGDLGWTFNYSFDTSPNSSAKHPIAELQVPFLVNKATDPVYFIGTGLPIPGCPNDGNPFSGYCNAFSSANPPNGFAPKFSTNTVVGMAPSAAPQCPGNQPGTLCPSTGNSPPNEVTLGNPPPVPPTFGFCASFSNSPAAAFFLAVGTEGSVIVLSPVAAVTRTPYPACPS